MIYVSSRRISATEINAVMPLSCLLSPPLLVDCTRSRYSDVACCIVFVFRISKNAKIKIVSRNTNVEVIQFTTTICDLREAYESRTSKTTRHKTIRQSVKVEVRDRKKLLKISLQKSGSKSYGWRYKLLA